MIHRRIRLPLLAALLLARTAAAQRPDSTQAGAPPDSLPPLPAAARADTLVPAAAPAASPPLPFQHWAVQAAWRAEALGLARFLPAERSVPRGQVAQALREAAAHAPPALRGLTAGWLARFQEEYPEYAAAAAARRRALRPLGVALGGGYQAHQGRLAPVRGYNAVPQPLPDVSGPRASARGGVATGPAALELEGVLRGGAMPLRSWEAAVGLGGWQLSAGREPVGFGNGRTGAVVFSDPDPLPRVELQTRRPFRLPWVLHALGPTTVDVFAGPVNDPGRHPTHPGLMGMRVAVQPHPRLTLGANRGSMFGGDSVRTTPLRVLRMLVGVVHSTYENQVISLDARYRLPSDAVLPATVYLEWGADDAAGAMDEEPARVMGLLLPALPGAREVAMGAEYTFFRRSCCGHGPWYLNTTFPGHWVVHQQPLGHPLGGEGAEYALYAQGEWLASRLRLAGRVYRADRSNLSAARYGGANLFAPTRGRSTGGQLEAAWRLGPHLDLRARLAREAGSGWHEQQLETGITWLH